MKVEKNKIVFALVLLAILLFLVAYYAMTFGDEEEKEVNKNQIPVPELEDGQKQYGSKLEALEDLKEEREKTAPSLYPEHMVDEKGYFNPDYMEYEKQRIIDSIYQVGQTRYEVKEYQNLGTKADDPKEEKQPEKDTISEISIKEKELAAKELGLEHQLFFASNPLANPDLGSQDTDAQIFVRVDGTQIVKKDYRLQMRLTKDAIIRGKLVPKNTPIYGFVSFKPNRTLVEIENINHRAVKLKAFDLQDGSEGIYVENGFKAQVSQEVIGDMVDDINITGVPQIGGIKKIFQRNHRTVKVTILDNYQLLLKPRK